MAIMSFAHLKKNTAQQAPVFHGPGPDHGHGNKEVSPAPVHGPGPLMSFAHLKREAVPAGPTTTSSSCTTRLQRPRAIGIEKTALIAAANYCDGCPRFWPADENEMRMGVDYGRCCRSSDDGVEVWQIIPTTARVARCWYHVHWDDLPKKELRFL